MQLAQQRAYALSDGRGIEVRAVPVRKVQGEMIIVQGLFAAPQSV